QPIQALHTSAKLLALLLRPIEAQRSDRRQYCSEDQHRLSQGVHQWRDSSIPIPMNPTTTAKMTMGAHRRARQSARIEDCIKRNEDYYQGADLAKELANHLSARLSPREQFDDLAEEGFLAHRVNSDARHDLSEITPDPRRAISSWRRLHTPDVVGVDFSSTPRARIAAWARPGSTCNTSSRTCAMRMRVRSKRRS